MKRYSIGRRELMLASAAFALAPAAKAEEEPPIHVVKGRGCECCEAWVDYLREQGFTVTDEVSMGTLLIRFKMDPATRAPLTAMRSKAMSRLQISAGCSTSVLTQSASQYPACPTALPAWDQRTVETPMTSCWFAAMEVSRSSPAIRPPDRSISEPNGLGRDLTKGMATDQSRPDI